MDILDDILRRNEWRDQMKARPIPWTPYTNKAQERFTLCEESGAKAIEGRCPVHGGDACLASYRHPKAVGGGDTP